jgi:hypothetical protein
MVMKWTWDKFQREIEDWGFFFVLFPTKHWAETREEYIYRYIEREKARQPASGPEEKSGSN